MSRIIAAAPWEKDMNVYRAIYIAADRGLPCPRADDLAEIIGGEEGGAISTTVLIMHRLEHRGLIQTERYQRARVVTIMETGKRTAEPRCKTPHWRSMRVA